MSKKPQGRPRIVVQQKRATIVFEAAYIDAFDRWVDRQGFRSRSAGIRELIERLVRRDPSLLDPINRGRKK